MNTLKTTFFLGLLSFMIMFLGFLLAGKSGVFSGLMVSSFLILVAFWCSDKLVLYLYQAKELKQKAFPDIYRMVEKLACRGKIPPPKIYMINHPMPNAFATGRNPKHGVLVLTKGLLDLLNPNELSGVLGHELFHVQKRGTFLSTITAIVAGGFSILGRVAGNLVTMGEGSRKGKEKSFGAFGAFLLIILTPIAVFLVRIGHSKSQELKADQYGAHLCGNPLYLANALRKIHQGVVKIPMMGGSGMAHMFTVNPHPRKGLNHLFSTHPPIEDRLNQLEAMAQEQAFFRTLNKSLQTQEEKHFHSNQRVFTLH